MNSILYLVRHCQATGQEPNAPLTTIGSQQAGELAVWFSDHPIDRIVSSPYERAYQSIVPLAKQFSIPIETEERLKERVFCETALPDWQERLAASFADLDLCLPGGESSRTAMARGISVLEEVLQQEGKATVVVTHGNLLTLLLKHFDDTVGFLHWQRMTNPDVYRLRFQGQNPSIERILSGEAQPWP